MSNEHNNPLSLSPNSLRNKWSLVPHEVSQTHGVIWLGTLFADLRKPHEVKVVITNDQGQAVGEQRIPKSQWQRPFRQITQQRFYITLTFDGLSPVQLYKVAAYEILANELAGEGALSSQLIITGQFTTLPESIASMADGFTLGLGSCFYEEYDGGAVSTAWQTLCKAPVSPCQPHIKFMTGDQVYLDIGWDSLSTRPREIRERVANDYAQHWQALSGMLRHGGSWFVADDHEYWNNFPLVQGWSPFIQALRIKSVKKAWLGTAMDGAKQVQRVEPVKVFSIGNDVSFCVVDLRTWRTEKNTLPKKAMDQLLSWVKNLTCPGILVLSQPLMEPKAGDGDRNFVSYQKQYNQLIKAIAEANFDVLSLSGDVHHGRLSRVEFSGRSNRLFEVVSSPMSNLAGISGIATSHINSKTRLKSFPAEPITGMPEASLHYDEPWRVSTENNLLDFRYPLVRTKEHFFTLTLTKTLSNTLQVTVRAWLPREKDRKTGLPRQDWREPATFEMK